MSGIPSAARLSAYVFLAGVALVELFGFCPALRTLPGAKSALGMPRGNNNLWNKGGFMYAPPVR